MTDNEFAEALDKYGDMVYRIAAHILRNPSDIEDICQNVFLKLYDKAPSFADEEHRKAWLIRVTINQSKNECKNAWNRTRSDLSEVDGSREDSHSSIMNEVRRLPIKYRSVIYLHYYEGYSVDEIGKMLGKNSNTIKTWMKRGRDILKVSLEG